MQVKTAYDNDLLQPSLLQCKFKVSGLRKYTSDGSINTKMLNHNDKIHTYIYKGLCSNLWFYQQNKYPFSCITFTISFTEIYTFVYFPKKAFPRLSEVLDS